jgi:RNA polymerase sigma factor (sigma-70 family)
MTGPSNHPLLRHLPRLTEALVGAEGDLELLGAFARGKSEAAFAALMRRHGPMVFALCRRILGNQQDAEDAFQATFLVLARKAGALPPGSILGGWLYGVASRTARKLRADRARRSAREAAAPVPGSGSPVPEVIAREALALVDDELGKLPEKFRAPLVLCCLEGLARDEAARQLGWPASLVKSRLEQARELLRRRLAGRGLTVSAVSATLGQLESGAGGAAPPLLAGATVQTAVATASGLPVTTVSAGVLLLSERMVRTMFWEKFKGVSAVLLLLGALAAGATGAVLAARDGAGPAAADRPPPGPAEPPPAKARARPAALALKAEALTRWGQAEIVCVARLERAQARLPLASLPPVHRHKLQLQVEGVLRGAVDKGAKLEAYHYARQDNEPVFPIGKACLVALRRSQGLGESKVTELWEAVAIEERGPAALAEVKQVCALPVGWSVEKGRLVSPWAALGPKAWPAAAKGKGPLVCSKSGRPALLAGAGVQLTVEPVLPAKVLDEAPNGDGEYKITVKNVTGKAVVVPALLSDGGKVHWEESLVILCQGQAYPAPGAKGVQRAPAPTVLRPGEAVSTVVNVLRLQGPEWPGMGPLDFHFALGDKIVTRFFFYSFTHHDALRRGALGGKKK